MLTQIFFNQDTLTLAKSLLGKVMRVKHSKGWLSAMIIETEAYCLDEKSSHSSKGFTEKRKAMFMSPGTIYMYYSRGGDSMNISAKGEGNAVLIKSGIPYQDKKAHSNMISIMQTINPKLNTNDLRTKEKLCAGQTLLCKSLGITVKEWDQKQFQKNKLFIEDINYSPKKIINTPRLGIPEGRDEHLLYRFIDHKHTKHCTQNPLTKRKWQLEKEYYIL